MRFAEDLEPVADPEHRAAGLGVPRNGLHRGGEARYGPGAQVIPVGKPSRHDDYVDPVEAVLLVPDHACVADPPAGRQRVTVVARARELKDAEPHLLTSIS